MTELTIKSDQPEIVKSEIQSALDAQQRMVQDSLRRTRLNLAHFEKKFGHSTSDLLRKESELDDDNLELIEWLGEARLLERLQAELDLLDGIRICS